MQRDFHHGLLASYPSKQEAGVPKETAEGPVLLQVTSLTTVFDLGDREAAAVRAVSFVIRVGEQRLRVEVVRVAARHLAHRMKY